MDAGSGAGRQPGKDDGEFLLQSGQVILNRSPDFLDVHTEVLVNQHVARGDDLRPWHVRVSGKEFVAQLAGGLSDDLYVVNEPRLEQFILFDCRPPLAPTYFSICSIASRMSSSRSRSLLTEVRLRAAHGRGYVASAHGP